MQPVHLPISKSFSFSLLSTPADNVGVEFLEVGGKCIKRTRVGDMAKFVISVLQGFAFALGLDLAISFHERRDSADSNQTKIETQQQEQRSYINDNDTQATFI